MNKLQVMLETVSVLLEDAACADSIEKAQDCIEKAKELQDKAIEKLDKVSDCADDKKEDEPEKDEKKEAKEEAITEAIDCLLNLASLCESVEEADGYIQKAEELQKEIEDIPEEKPVENDEYPEETYGGEGKQEDHLEAIKDLIDGDSKAMELLTKDPDTLTID